MSFSVVIPFRSEEAEPTRTASFEFVKNFWEYNYDCELIYADSKSARFNRSEARNNGVGQASNENLVLCDADTFCDVSNVTTAFSKLNGGSSWVLPFTRYYRLSREFSNQVILKNKQFIDRPYYDMKFVKNSWSGVVCLTKDMFNEVGGYNEGYLGWGFEDYEFKDVLDRKIGPHERLSGSAYHLWHEVSDGSTKDSDTFGINAKIYEKSKLR